MNFNYFIKIKYNLLIYFLITLLGIITILSWSTKGILGITGDEPHYIVMADGIINYGTFEQTLPYKEEFKTKKIYSTGLAKENELPNPSNTHAVLGSRGLFNVHNIGLPLLISVPYKLFGIIGIKIFLIMAVGLISIITYNMASNYFKKEFTVVFVTLSILISKPVILGANQIYPDLVSGLLALLGIYGLMISDNENHLKSIYKSPLLVVTTVIGISFLPWLHLKNLTVAITLLLSHIYFNYRKHRNDLSLIYILSFFISLSLLFYYNWYAFDSIAGPYSEGSLKINLTAIRVLFGLHFDQFHGMFIQNPIYIFGFLGMFSFFKRYKLHGIVIILIYAFFIVPNALHVNWYGGWSFSGRFMWSAYVVFIPLVIYGLSELESYNIQLFKAILFICLVLNIVIYFYNTFGIKSLYMLYNLNGAKYIYFYANKFLPLFLIQTSNNYDYFLIINTIFITTFVIISIISLIKKKYIIKFNLATISIGFSTILIYGFFNNYNPSVYIPAIHLPSQTGKIVGYSRCVDSKDDNGFLNYGPYILLNKGLYKFAIEYHSIMPLNSVAASWDIYNAFNNKTLKKGFLYGTNNDKNIFIGNFYINDYCNIEIRTFHEKGSQICLHGITINKIDESFDYSMPFRRESKIQDMLVKNLEEYKTKIILNINRIVVNKNNDLEIPIRIENTSKSIFPSKGDPSGRYAVFASYHILDKNHNMIIHDGMRTSFPHDIAPGVIIPIKMKILANAPAGEYILAIDLVHEGVTWFGDKDKNNILEVPLVVK